MLSKTRIHIDVILEALAAGEIQEDILENYPRLKHVDIAAALTYAAEVLQPISQ